MSSHPKKPEVLAPAGDRASLEAAVRAGADAVYFGLGQGFNARARATNFAVEELGKTLAWLHQHGAKGYVTLNTLVFDDELASVERAIRACAEAGVDAVIVQDLGVAKLARAIAPSLPVHASTQMTCTDAASAELAKELGASRVILARELSLDDIAKIREGTDVEVEVFVHGALCISYSGQCLTSEAIGGRSANRGACAQACRLPYELVVDGELQSTEQSAYLLSPEDLEASSMVPALMKLGVSSLKIEGRLKGPEYVAATTRLYRSAVEGALNEGQRLDALQTFTRGSGPGFFPGVDHQRLVEGRSCDHRGLLLGTLVGVENDKFAAAKGSSKARSWLVIDRLECPLSRGDGLLIEGGLASEGELGGRIWLIEEVVRGAKSAPARDVENAAKGARVRVWLGPDVVIPASVMAASSSSTKRRIHKTSSPSVLARIRATTSSSSASLAKGPLAMRIAGAVGEPFVLEGTTERGQYARVTGDANVELARSAPVTAESLREKLGKLGDTAFELGALTVDLPPNVIVPLSSLNRARRSLVAAFDEAPISKAHPTTDVECTKLLDAAEAPVDRAPPAPGLFVLCRTVAQASAALEAGAEGVYLDFLELTGTGDAVRLLRASRADAFVGVAPPRIRKPGEEKIDRFLTSLAPNATLVRGLGALREVASGGSASAAIGDFSLNVTNRITAAEVLSRGLAAFTPSFDLDAAQLLAFAKTSFGPWMEIVLHHPMALFHMEHCVIAALLSDGGDYKTCGRPCEKHRVSLRDRAGMDHPVEADVGCRNTVFHAKPQSAVQLLPELALAGVKRFRIELVRESAEDVTGLVKAYRRAIDDPSASSTIWRELRAEGGYGVVKGSLRVIS